MCNCAMPPLAILLMRKLQQLICNNGLQSRQFIIWIVSFSLLQFCCNYLHRSMSQEKTKHLGFMIHLTAVSVGKIRWHCKIVLHREITVNVYLPSKCLLLFHRIIVSFNRIICPHLKLYIIHFQSVYIISQQDKN